MQNPRTNWRAQQGNRALKTIAEIEASIVALDGESLLDLHDIFREQKASTLCRVAYDEIVRRGLKPAFD